MPESASHRFFQNKLAKKKDSHRISPQFRLDELIR